MSQSSSSHGRQKKVRRTKRRAAIPSYNSTGLSGHAAWNNDAPPVAESSAMAAARATTTAPAAEPAATSVATGGAYIPTWFPDLPPGHESDQKRWATELAVRATCNGIPYDSALVMKLYAFARLAHWKARVAEKELTATKASSAEDRAAEARAGAAEARANAVVTANAVKEAKKDLAKREQAEAAAKRERGAFVDKAIGVLSDQVKQQLDTLNEECATAVGRVDSAISELREARSDHRAAQQAVNDTKAEAIAAARVLDAAVQTAVDAVGAAADAAADAGITDTSGTSSADILSAIVRAKAAVDQHINALSATSAPASSRVEVSLLGPISEVIIAGSAPSYHSEVPYVVLMATDVRHDPGILQAVKTFQRATLAMHPGLESSTVWLDVATDRCINQEADVMPLFEAEVVSRVTEIAAKTHPHIEVEWVRGNPTGHADGFFILRFPGGGRDGGEERSTMVAVEHKQPFLDATSEGKGKRKGKRKGKDKLKGAEARAAAVTKQVGLHTPRALVEGIVGQLAQYLAAPKAIRMPAKLRSHPRYHMGLMTDINHTWLVSCPDASRWRAQGKEGTLPLTKAVTTAIRASKRTDKGKALDPDDHYLGSTGVSGCIRPGDTDPPLVMAIAYVIAQAADSLHQDSSPGPQADTREESAGAAETEPDITEEGYVDIHEDTVPPADTMAPQPRSTRGQRTRRLVERVAGKMRLRSKRKH